MYLKDASKFKGTSYANTIYQLFLSALGIREKQIIDDDALKEAAREFSRRPAFGEAD